ncbi:MAG: IS110 family transposase [Burkholderiales bacterium]
MKLYGGIDLHSNNSVVVVIDEQDRVVYEKRLRNDLELILAQLAPYRKKLAGLVVESTYNWYWLVDGLMDSGYHVRLANTAAIKQYEGLKHTDDAHDARWLAHLLRLGILPVGYIYPRQARAVRDLLRRRHRLVRERVSNLLSIQNQFARLGLAALSAERLKRLQDSELSAFIADGNVRSAVVANLALVRCLNAQIERLEREVLAQVKLAAQFAALMTISGIGKILALTIMLETGEIGRFSKVGQFASYARCVDSQRLSNGKKKGVNNAKCGNAYLAWAFVEAANFACRYSPRVKRFFDRKCARTNKIVAFKACAHKLARAAFYVMRDRVPFDEARAFS